MQSWGEENKFPKLNPGVSKVSSNLSKTLIFFPSFIKCSIKKREGDSVVNLVDELSPLIKLEKTLDLMCEDQYNLERGRNVW